MVEANEALIQQLKESWAMRKERVENYVTESTLIKFFLLAGVGYLNPFWLCTYNRKTKTCTVDELNIEL